MRERVAGIRLAERMLSGRVPRPHMTVGAGIAARPYC